MKTAIIAGIASLFAAATMAAPTDATVEVSSSPQYLGPLPLTSQSTTANLTSDPNGYLHLADDGVLRSYTANGTVLSYKQLSNAQIKSMVAFAPAWYINGTAGRQHLVDVFTNVSGHGVTDKEQLTNPPAHLRRPTLHKTAVDDSTTVNSAVAAKEALDKRTTPNGMPACAGMPCAGQLQCTAAGCQFCIYFDSFTGEFGMCVPQGY